MGWSFGLGCDCCDCPQLVCASVRCGKSPIAGATVEVRAAATPVGSGALVDSGTTDANGSFCATITTAGDYDVVVSKDGYHTATSGPHSAACDTGLTVLVALVPTTMRFCYQAVGCNGNGRVDGVATTPDGGPCPVAGVEVEVSGDASASGVTDDDGRFCADLEVPADGILDLTVTATAPSGQGWDTTPQTQALSYAGAELCAEHLTIGSFSPDAAHWCSEDVHDLSVCGRPLPETLSYSDDYGSCTLTRTTGGGYRGSYTYTSECAAEDAGTGDCPPYTLPGSGCQWRKTTKSVPVDVFVSLRPPNYPSYQCQAGYVARVARNRYYRPVFRSGTCDCHPDHFEGYAFLVSDHAQGTFAESGQTSTSPCDTLPVVSVSGTLVPSTSQDHLVAGFLCEVGSGFTITGA